MSTEVRRRPRDRRAQILATAGALFARRGFAAVSIDEIGAAVGVSGPAIYRHFAGKDALLVAILEESLGRMANALVTVDDVRGSVGAALDESSGMAIALREAWRLEALGESAGEVVALQRAVMRHWSRVLQSLSPGIRRPADAVRQLAVLGQLSTVVLGRRSPARPRLDELLAESAERIFRSPPASVLAVDGATHAPVRGRRDDLLAGSIELFRARGFAGVGVAEVAEASGMSPATLYHHYTSKADLLLDAYDRVGQRVELGVEAAIATASSPHDALERLAMSFASIAVDNVPLIVVTTREAGALPTTAQPRLRRRRKLIRQRWGDVVSALRSDLDGAEVRFVVSAAFDAMAHAAQAIENRPEHVGEVAGVAVAHVGATA